MKKSILRRLSLRAKLKGDNVEVVIINIETGEIQFEHIPLKLGSSFPGEKEESEEDIKLSAPDTDVEVADNSESEEETDEEDATSEVVTDGN